MHRRIGLQLVACERDRLGLAVPGIAASSHGCQVEGLPDPISGRSRRRTAALSSSMTNISP
jgi:hypothetical protein